MPQNTRSCGVFDWHGSRIRRGMLSAVLAAALAAVPASDLHGDFAHIRTSSRHVHAFIDEVRTQSGTFAALIDRLDRTNVAVYIQMVSQIPAYYLGQLHFVGTSGPFRFVRIQIRAGLPYADRAASLAHELRHAIEIGEHDEVRCERTLEALYRRIGEHRATRGYETRAAIEAGRQVRAELLTPSARSRAAACSETDADVLASSPHCAP